MPSSAHRIVSIARAEALPPALLAVSTTANVELLRSIGTDEVVDYTKEDFSRRGQHFDVLFDIGANRSFADCRRVFGSNGKLVLVGASGGALRSVGRLVRGQLMSRIGRQRIVTFLTKIRQEDLVALKLLVEAGKLSPVLDRQYELNEVPDAIRYVGSRHAKGKVVIKVA